MTARRLILAVLLLACGFAVGLVITARLHEVDTVAAQDSAPATPAGAPGPIALPAAGTLPDFTRVAERTVPAVINISSLQVVQRPDSPFANDPFFRYFFGDGNDMFGTRRGVESSLGSGVVVSEDGYILTNNHVVAGGGRPLEQLPAVTVVLGDRRELPAQIVGLDAATDLALLKVEATGLPTIPWGDSSGLKVAEWVLAIGNPFQLNQSVSLGIVSAVGRSNVGIAAYEEWIQTDAAINPGNSGGALVNGRGELVGINTAIFSQSGGYQGIGFAVPSNLARRVVDDLTRYGEVRRGSIGYVEVTPVTTQIATELGAPDARGVLVARMRRDSAAYEGGMRPGDIIVDVNGTPIEDVGRFSRLVQDAPIGSTATVTVVREGRRVQLQVPVERRSPGA